MPRYHPGPAPPDLELAAWEREFDALYANGERDLTGAQLVRLEWLAEDRRSPEEPPVKRTRRARCAAPGSAVPAPASSSCSARSGC
jgi:hypothetical protein